LRSVYEADTNDQDFGIKTKCQTIALIFSMIRDTIDHMMRWIFFILIISIATEVFAQPQSGLSQKPRQPEQIQKKAESMAFSTVQSLNSRGFLEASSM
jgi:hypothetical protein